MPGIRWTGRGRLPGGGGLRFSSWAVILAGGRGTRMQPAITRWLGQDRPKQFCTFIGTRSMLEHTMDRAAAVCPQGHILTVISRGQMGYIDEILSERGAGWNGPIVEQSAELGTAPGIQVALSYVSERDPDATVVVLPSDHFVYPEADFLHCVDAALSAADRWNDHIILLAANPTGPETDYGWIEPARTRQSALAGNPGLNFMGVSAFSEKPDPETAAELYARGGFWNTMVMVGKARAFNVLTWRALPEMMWRFETLRQVLRAIRAGRAPRDHEDIALSHVYQGLARADFSRDILQPATPWTLVLPMEGVYWSDWGRPERLQETMTQLRWSNSISIPILAAGL